MTMKVQTEQEQVISLTKVAKGRVSREEVNQGGAIQGLLDKLKDLVPNMPRSKKLTKLEIIQNVIDYILDLEIALEAHPTNLSTSSSPPATTRQPLGALPAANSITNALSEDEVTTEKVIRHFAALGSAVAPTDAMSNLDL
ncbi:hypothetical protein MRX96_057242 [Rhipicephalus microplus]|uniref:DNA-binding protein inhibitor ID-2-like n=1 Tax=Rhipicephalus microplus TaxID=6941 RepID=UPI003F6B1C0D